MENATPYGLHLQETGASCQVISQQLYGQIA